MNSLDILDKTLITGGEGMVASYIDFGVKVDRKDFDISNLDQVLEFVQKMKPKVLLHLAALTDLTKCEEDPSLCYSVNSVGTYNLALAAKRVGARMVYVSTDAVFSNSKNPHSISDEVGPESVYGHAKYLGELVVSGMSEDNAVVRTSWVFGGGKDKDKKFVGKFVSQLDKSEATAVNDQLSSPTYAKDLVAELKKIILENKTGIFHVVNSGTASRYDMGVLIKKVLQKDTKINPVPASTFGLLPYQESSGGLLPNISMRPWEEALTEYLEKEWKI